MTTPISKGPKVRWDVFISYSRLDKEPVETLVRELQRRNLSVWQDTLELRHGDSITPGVKQGLIGSKLYVLWYSSNYLTRLACQLELIFLYNLSQQRGTKPLRRIFVINPDHSRDHIHPLQLADQLFDPSLMRPTIDFSALGELIQQRAASLDDALEGEPSSGSSRRWGRSFSAVAHRFIGRSTELWKLHGTLWAEEHAQTSKQLSGGSVIVCGLAGQGKSLLVEIYAARFSSFYRGGIFWFSATNDQGTGSETADQTRINQFGALARHLGLSWRDGDIDDLSSQLATTFEQIEGTYLWIVDDLPSGAGMTTARKWAAPSGNGHTIFTTKSREYQALCPSLDLEALAPAEALILLTGDPLKLSSPEKEAAQEISALLYGHALALAVVSPPIANRGGPAAFRSHLADLKRNLLDAIQTSANLSAELPNGHDKNVAFVLRRSIDALSRDARDLLVLASLGTSAPMPHHLLRRAFGSIHGLAWRVARDRTEAAVNALSNSSVARVDSVNQQAVVEVHGLVQEVVQMGPEAAARSGHYLNAFGMLLTEEVALGVSPLAYDRVRVSLPHAQALAHRPRFSQNGALRFYLARFHQAQGAYQDAAACYRTIIDESPRGRLSFYLTQAVRGYAACIAKIGPAAETAHWYDVSLSSHVKIFSATHPRARDAYIDRLEYRVLTDVPQQEAVLREKLRELETPIDLSGKYQMLRLHLIYARLLRRKGRDAEAFLQLRKALQGIRDFAFEGNSARLETMLEMARILLDLGWIRNEPGIMGAMHQSMITFEHAVRVLGFAHPYTVEAIECWARAFEAEGNLDEARRLRIGIREKCRVVEAAEPDRFAALCARVRLPSSIAADSADIDAACGMLDHLVANSISPDALDEVINQNVETEFGKDDWISNVFSQGNQLMGTAHRADQAGEFDLAAALAAETLRHYRLTRKPDDPKIVIVTRKLAFYLAKVNDFFQARSLLRDLLEQQVEAADLRKATVSSIAFELTLLCHDAPDTKREIFQNYLEWIIWAPLGTLSSGQAALWPAIFEEAIRLETSRRRKWKLRIVRFLKPKPR